jgi:hypothetical protein
MTPEDFAALVARLEALGRRSGWIKRKLKSIKGAELLLT